MTALFYLISLDINIGSFVEADYKQTHYGSSLNLSISTIQTVVSTVTVAAQLKIVYR